MPSYQSKILSEDLPIFEGASIIGIVPDPITETGKYLKDDGTWETILKRTWNFHAARSAAAQPDQYLRRQNGLTTNQTPYIVPRNATIWAATGENQNTTPLPSWDLVVEVNGTSVLTLNIPSGSNKTTDDSLSINVNQGDEIALRMLNSTDLVDRPAGAVFLIER